MRDAGAYLYVGPVSLVFVLFTAFPVAFALWLTFHQWNGYTDLAGSAYVGIQNYATMVSDPVFGISLLNTVIFTSITTVIQMAIALALAYFLWLYRPRFAVALRTLYFFPAILSMIVVGLGWRELLTIGGPVDEMTAAFGLGQPDFLGDPSLVLPVVIWVSCWQWSGWTMVLFSAGLSGIPNEVVEASALDGATSGVILRRIAVPLLSPVTAIAFLLNVIGGFQVFDTIWVLTGGGPVHASEVLSTYAYREAFGSGGGGPGLLGYAATISIAMLLILFVFAIQRVRASGVS